MAAENLADVINSLTPEQQESGKQFVEFLKRKASPPSSPFLAAVDEFIDQHPELLRRWPSDLLPDRGLIGRFGGALGIRDRGALESALTRPQSGYYADLIQEAAALWESLS